MGAGIDLDSFRVHIGDLLFLINEGSMTPDEIEGLLENNWRKRTREETVKPGRSRLSAQSEYRNKHGGMRPSRRRRWKTRLFWFMLFCLFGCICFYFYHTARRPSAKGMPFRPIPSRVR